MSDFIAELTRQLHGWQDETQWLTYADVARMVRDAATVARLAQDHKLRVPASAGAGLTSWVATCDCGARWRVGYDDKNHIQWTPQNDAAERCPLGAAPVDATGYGGGPATVDAAIDNHLEREHSIV